MRNTIRLSIVTITILLAAIYAHAQQEIRMKFSSPSTLSKFLKEIENQTSFHFSYDSKSISDEMRIELPSESMSVQEVLDYLKQKYQIVSQNRENVIILKKAQPKPLNKTLSGVVQDEVTGERLPGVQVTLVNSNSAVTSNAYGFYSISGKAGTTEMIRMQSLGYAIKDFNFSFSRDSIAIISLSTKSIDLSEVTIQANKYDGSEIVYSDGAFVMSAAKVKDIGTFAGEPDPLKAIQFLPGVTAGTEGTTSFSVRGGSNDQNLFLLDEAPVYNPAHALGFFSIFNPDALQLISLHKSEIPVAYGGRLSSVVNVRTKEGNRKNTTCSGTVGTIASRFTVEGPVSKKNENISFIASGRYSYAGPVVNGLYFAGQFVGDPTSNISTTDNQIDFYDLNAKINFRSNDKNHFYLSAYTGHDNFYFNHITNGYSLSWGNTTATARWNHTYNARLFSNTTALFSNYNYEYHILNNTRYFLWTANLKEFDVKQDYDFYINNRNHLTFGGGIEAHWIMPGRVSPRNNDAVTKTYTIERQQPIGTYVYAGNTQVITENLFVKYGIRYSNFILMGPGTRYYFDGSGEQPSDSATYDNGEIEEVYHRIDPRASIHYSFGKNAVSFSYDRTTQYFHLLANSSVGLPTDVWLPSGGKIKPQYADIYAFTFQRPLGKGLEGMFSMFYKKINHITDFKDNANLFVNRYVESQLLQGRGASYGAEFFLQKTVGKLTGSISYTLSKTQHQIEGVNDGKKYSPRYDKTHNLSITSKVELSKRWQVGCNYVYITGGAITVPSGNFTFDQIVLNTYTTRNGFRLPDYHRLDISLRWNSKKNENRKFKSYWVFDIYNVYAKKNPITVYSQPDDYGFVKADVSAIYLFGVIPTVSYNFTF